MSEIPPPISPNDRPALHKIGEYPFQDLTVDLMAREPDLRQAMLYGTRGQRQYGGDAIAECATGGTVVAQCKCYEEMDDSDIRKACAEFLDNLTHWKTFDVRRFILASACDLISTKLIGELREQKKRFKKKGIAFESWDRIIIVQKLHLQRGLVHRYLGSSQTWVDMLCGPPDRGTASISSSTSEVEFQRLQSILVSHVEAELSRLRDVLRQGRRGEVRSALKALRDHPDEWAHLRPKVQAGALRLEAGLELDAAGDIQRAKACVSEARKLDPDSKLTRLETRIRLIEEGPQEALNALPDEDDLETLCARGSLLLVSGNAQESVRVLKAAKERDPRDADVLRLLALSLLVDGDVEGAWSNLANLLAIAPLWEVVRQTKAVICYVSALSFPALQNPASPMPEPVEWSLVKRDDLSLQRITEAEEIFNGLLADLGRTRDDRQMLEIWRLACLANHPGRQKEAEEFCATIVSQHPCNIYALPWASARGYRVDYARIGAVAELEVAREPTRLGPLLIAAASKLQAKDAPGTLALLDQHRARFEQNRQGETWDYYWAMALVLNNNPRAALEFIAPLPRTQYLRRIEITALKAQARRTSDPGPLLERLDHLYQSTHDPTLLVDLCNEYASLGNWPAVADRSNELLEKIPCQDSLLLALVADYNTREFERCLRRIERFRDWFPSKGVPLDVKRMRIGCLERRGLVREALQEARDLVQEDASTETLVSFIRLCLKFGDIENALAGSRDLTEREDVTPEKRIAVAELIVPYAPELSRRLVRAALPASIPPEHVPPVLQLGSRLELERELQGLWQRGVELAGEGTVVRAMNQDEFTQLRERRQVHQANLVNVYERGQTFIHRLIDELGFNLPQIYWRECEHEFSPLENPHVLIRHGRRSAVAPSKIFPSSARLNLDITSVLLIERLQLWRAVCRAFTEVRFSSDVIPFLQETLHRTGSRQPAWERGEREVVELWQSGLITSDADLADLVVADSQPPHAEVPHLRPRVIAEILRGQGRLEHSAYEHAIQILGDLSEGEDPSGLPGKIEKLYCSGSTAILLSVAGLLRPLTSIAVVAVDLALLEWLRASAALQGERATVEQHLRKLIEFLGHEIQAARIRLVPEPARESRIDTPCAHCVADLLLFEPSPDDVICIDDRFMNGHWTRDNDVDITSTYDLLPTLIERKELSKTDTFGLVHQLRRANLWFLPLDPDEIAHWLALAGIDDGGVVETPELAVIRKYWAACTRRADLLQRGNPEAIPPDLGEVSFITRSRQTIAEATAVVWANINQSDQARLARCGWIIDSLYLDITGFRRAGGVSGPPEIERRLSSLDVVLLFTNGLIRMRPPAVGQTSLWEQYVEWVWGRVFQRRYGYEPEMIDAVVSQLEDQFRRWARSGESVDKKSVGSVVYRIIQGLPTVLRDRLQASQQLLEQLGVETTQIVKVGDHRFASPDFANAVAEALEKGSSTLQTLQEQESANVRRIAPDVATAIDIEFPALRTVVRMGNRFWGLFLPAIEEQRKSLVASRGLFDLNDEDFDALVEKTLSVADRVERIERILVAARDSLPYFYFILREQLRSEEPLREAQLLPISSDSLLAFHGINIGRFAESAHMPVMDRIASSLLRRLDWAEVLARLGGLPSPLPATIEGAFAAASLPEQSRAIHVLLRVSLSPVRRIHALRLISQSGTQEGRFIRLQSFLLRQLLTESAALSHDAYLAILRWTDRALARWPDAHQWPRMIRSAVAWCHADRLFGTYVKGGADFKWLSQLFTTPAIYGSLLDLQEDFVVGRDVSDATIFDRKTLLLNGFGYAFDGREIGLDQRTGLKSYIFVDEVPPVHVWETAGGPNQLSSFLGRDRLQDLQNLLGAELATRYDPAWRSNILIEALENLKSAPHSLVSWFAIAAVFRDLPAPDDVEEQIASCLTKLDFVALAEIGRSEPLNRVLPLLAGRIAHARNADARRHISTDLVRLAAWYGGNQGTDEEASQLVSMIMAYAFPAEGRNRTAPEFEECCVSCAKGFPKITRALRSVVGELGTDLPGDQAARFWPLLLRLRAL